jgi:hypothetical protein
MNVRPCGGEEPAVDVAVGADVWPQLASSAPLKPIAQTAAARRQSAIERARRLASARHSWCLDPVATSGDIVRVINAISARGLALTSTAALTGAKGWAIRLLIRAVETEGGAVEHFPSRDLDAMQQLSSPRPNAASELAASRR